MNPITQALRAGHSAEKILEYLSGTNSELASKINGALGAGYSAKAVLDFVFKSGKNVSNILKTPDKEEQSLYKKVNYIEPGLKRSLMTGGALLGGILGLSEIGAIEGVEALGAGEALGAAETATAPVQEVIQKIGPSFIEDIFAEKELIPTELTPSQNEQMRFAQNIAKKFEKEGKDINDPAVQNLRKKIEGILTKEPKTVAEEFNRLKKGYPDTEIQQTEAQKMIAQPQGVQQETIENRIAKGEIPSTTEIAREKGIGYAEAAKLKEKLIEKTKQEPAKQQIIEKGSTVLTKNGDIAKVEDLPGITAKVKYQDGNTGVVKAGDLIDLPIPEKDLAALYDDVIKGVEKQTGQEVSRNVYLAGYDPQHNELFYKPHDGALYVYDNIDEDVAKGLTQFLTQRKTTGQNYIGSWTEGTDSPIGAAMSKLILDLQKSRGGKGQEYVRKYDILYDMLEPAKTARKEAHKKQKEAERERKRKEKAEAKKSRPR